MKKKIGFLLANISSKGGAERSFTNLANSLSEFYSVIAISCHYADRTAYELNNNIEVISLFRKKYKRMRNILRPRMLKKLRATVKKLDVLIVVSSASALGLVACIKIPNLKIITWEHTSLLNVLYMTTKRKMLISFAMMQSDEYIVLTNRDLEYIQKNKSPKCHVSAIHNGIFDYALNSSIYDDSSKQIITLARIDRVKGLDFLIDVANKVLSKYHEWNWKVYGQADDENYLRELSKKLNNSDVKNRLHFCNAIDNIQEKLKQSAIYVMTSRYEGLPMSLIEAKSFKLPLVAFDCNSGPSEIIEDGINGDLIIPYDTNMMADKISELIDDKNKRKRYSDGSYTNIDDFLMSNIVKKWIEVIEN